MKRASLARVCLMGLATLFAACSPASDPAVAKDASPQVQTALAVSGAWAAATPRGARVGAGYLTITNPADASDRLVSASSPRAPRVELHEMSMEGDLMRMRKVSGVDVPAHGAAMLSPGGFHLMFMDIATPFAAGETVPVTLTFARAGVREVLLPVRERQASGQGAAHAGH